MLPTQTLLDDAPKKKNKITDINNFSQSALKQKTVY